jgi:hypothetical protein
VKINATDSWSTKINLKKAHLMKKKLTQPTGFSGDDYYAAEQKKY